jgi:acetoacetyl-CoA synthetase
MAAPLWRPSAERVRESGLFAFSRSLESTWGVPLPDYWALHRFSVDHPERFWGALWDFCGVVAEARGEIVVEGADRMPGARWFPEARLNFAENLLRRRDDSPAIVFRGESGVRTVWTHASLFERVARLSRALRDWGVGPGDRVAGYLPNLPEAVAAMLATTSVGAIWSSCSPDFGQQGVLDRFGQIEPRVLFAADGYCYGGRRFDCLARVAELRPLLPSVERTVIVPYATGHPDLPAAAGAVLFDEVLAAHPADEIPFAQLPFDHPVYVLYSSGTTGPPKCIVHGAGGTLLQHLKEHRLHVDLRPGERLFYFTTCGWMMWNWLVSGLRSCSTSSRGSASPSSAPRRSTSTPWRSRASSPPRATTSPA